MKRFTAYMNWVDKHPALVCDYVKKAVARHRRDIIRSKTDPSFPYRFDRAKAQRFIDFCETLKQYKDRFAGEPLVLQPWQVFIFGSIYGWVRKDNGMRRFRKAFVFVARKNGKSTMSSPVLLWDILTVPGSEGYVAATKRDQSKIVYESVCKMIDQNPGLTQRLKQYRSTSTIVCGRTAGKIAALSSEYKTFDGLNPSCVIIDEVAAMPDYSIIQVLQSGTGARPEPLIFEITSGSDNTESAGHEEFERSEKILNQVYEDDTFFCILYTLDKGDDWRDSSKWIKANPNLGVSVYLETLQNHCNEALQNYRLEGEFRIKELCQFISPVTAWIPFSSWKRCIDNAQTLPSLYTLDMRQCVAVGAIDLSERLDFTSFMVMVYHIPSGRYYAEHHYYIPEGQIQTKCRTDSPLVWKWVELGLIRATKANDGLKVDYNTIFADCRDAIERLNVREILFDPWNAGQLVDELGPYAELVEIRQSMKDISPFAKDYEAAVTSGEIVDGNPVMRWMVSNCDIYTDANGNIKPVKHGGKASPKHIDGVITSLMAMGRIKSLLDGGYIDLREPEEIEADMERRLAAIDY